MNQKFQLLDSESTHNRRTCIGKVIGIAGIILFGAVALGVILTAFAIISPLAADVLSSDDGEEDYNDERHHPIYMTTS